VIVFLDFEASGLGKKGFPIEVGWAAEDGTEESHLIRPAPGWEEWDASVESIHGLTRAVLAAKGRPHDEVARRMVEALSGHALYASAPSWDGKWLSALLRAAGLPRHALRLRDTEEARQGEALSVLRAADLDAEEHAGLLIGVLEGVTREAENGTPAHRALADARRERDLWREARRRTQAAIAGLQR